MVSHHRLSRVLKRRGIPAEQVDKCSTVGERDKLDLKYSKRRGKDDSVRIDTESS